MIGEGEKRALIALIDEKMLPLNFIENGQICQCMPGDFLDSFLCGVCIFGFQRYCLCITQKKKHFIFCPWTSVGVWWVFVFKLVSVENSLFSIV